MFIKFTFATGPVHINVHASSNSQHCCTLWFWCMWWSFVKLLYLPRHVYPSVRQHAMNTRTTFNSLHEISCQQFYQNLWTHGNFDYILTKLNTLPDNLIQFCMHFEHNLKIYHSKRKKRSLLAYCQLFLVATNQNFRTIAMFLINILHQFYATNVAYFFQDLFPQTASRH